MNSELKIFRPLRSNATIINIAGGIEFRGCNDLGSLKRGSLAGPEVLIANAERSCNLQIQSLRTGLASIWMRDPVLINALTRVEWAPQIWSHRQSSWRHLHGLRAFPGTLSIQEKKL
jgi:hypothetical protein